MRIAVALFVGLLGSAPVASARAAEPTPVVYEGVTFSGALRAADEGPRERGLRDAVKIRRRGDARIRGISDPLQVNVYPGVRVAPQEERGPQLQLQVSQPISLERMGRAQKRAAKVERDVLSVAADAARLQRRLDVANAWLEEWALREQAEILRRELQALEGWLDKLRRLTEAGESTRIELATASAWRTEVELELLALEGMVHHAGLRLAELVGAPSGDPLLAVGDPPQVDLDPADLRRLANGAEELPAVARTRLAAAAARAREVEARAASGWKLTLGGMAELEQPGVTLGLFGQVGLQVPIWGRNERARSVERGEAAQLEGEADELALQSDREILDALHELRHTSEQLEALQERLVPALEEVVDLAQRSLRVGEATTKRVVEARQSSLAAHRRAAAVRGDHAWAELRVWLLIVALEQDTLEAAR